MIAKPRASNNTHLIFHRFCLSGIQAQINWVPPLKVSVKFQFSCWPSCRLSEGLTGTGCKLLHVVAGKSWFLSSESLHRLPPGPYTTAASGLRAREPESDWDGSRSLYRLVVSSDIISLLLLSFHYKLVMKSRLYSEGGDYTRARIPGDGDHEDHSGSGLPQLISTQIVGFYPRVSDLAGLGWGLRICMSNTFLAAVLTSAGPRTALWELLLLITPYLITEK